MDKDTKLDSLTTLLAGGNRQRRLSEHFASFRRDVHADVENIPFMVPGMSQRDAIMLNLQNSTELELVLRRELYDHLSPPQQVTLSEMQRVAAEAIASDTESAEEAVTSFRSKLDMLTETVEPCITSPIAMPTGQFLSLVDQKARPIIWDNPWAEVSFDTSNEAMTFDNMTYSPVMRLAINGQVSEQARDAFSEWLAPFVRSLLRCYSLSRYTAEYWEDDELQCARNALWLLPAAGPDVETIAGWQSRVRWWLDLYLAPRTKKDSFKRRLSNALEILVEADRVTNHGVGIALCFSAIEALIGGGSANISEQVAERGAMLLEPEPDLRAGAKSYIKNLYDRRSKAVHGSDIDMPLGLRLEARHLAATLCVELGERHSIVAGLGESEHPSDFARQLEEAKFTSRAVSMANDDYPVRVRWAPEHEADA